MAMSPSVEVIPSRCDGGAGHHFTIANAAPDHTNAKPMQMAAQIMASFMKPTCTINTPGGRGGRGGGGVRTCSGRHGRHLGRGATYFSCPELESAGFFSSAITLVPHVVRSASVPRAPLVLAALSHPAEAAEHSVGI